MKAALTYELTGNNNGTVTWHYSIADNALDFLGQDQTVKVVSTITLTDEYGKSDTADVTVTITGKNDAPVLSDGSIGKLTDTAVADHFPDLTGQLAATDVDTGDTLTYALLNSDHQTTSTISESIWCADGQS